MSLSGSHGKTTRENFLSRLWLNDHLLAFATIGLELSATEQRIPTRCFSESARAIRVEATGALTTCLYLTS
jgi:hypothetical protein